MVGDLDQWIDHRDERAHLREVEIHAARLPQPVVVVPSEKLLDTLRGGVVP